MNLHPATYGSHITLENPTVPMMMQACEELMKMVATTANAHPTLDLLTLCTWFQAAQDIDRGGITIRLYWTAQDERRPNK